MTRFLVLSCWLILVAVTPGISGAADRDIVLGHWASESSIFEIFLVNDTLSGEVRALRNPLYLPDEDSDRAGQVRRDDNNPDDELRGRPIIGLAMFSEYQYEDGQWQGKIYDPESGNTYMSRMKINKNGDLEIRGYIGMPMFGRTATFTPIQRCSPDVQLMLAQLDGEVSCP